MNSHDKLRLREREIIPTNEILKQTLGESYAAYEALQETLPSLDMEQEWQWYTPHKAWFAKGQHFWTTPRGTQKEKNLYWMHFFEGYFSIAIWFKEKNRVELLTANLSEETKQLICNADTMGKMPTFPVVFDIINSEMPKDVYELIECKKRLER